MKRFFLIGLSILALLGATNGVQAFNQEHLNSLLFPACPGCDLSGANLSGANLSGANLRQASLEGADLSKADLTGAKLSNATWTDGRKCGPDSIGKCD